MTSAERAAQKAGNVSRSSKSSQMAAVLAAHDKDEEASPPPHGGSGGGVKGKLDVMGMQEDMDIKREPDDSSGEIGGKGGMPKVDFKQEIKSEPFEDMSTVKAEIKEEPPDAMPENSTDTKPSNMEMISPSTTGMDKKRKCSK